MTRKIDKRACRKFAMPELEFNLNEGVLHVENCPYIIRTAVRNISGQRILVLYIYQSENILAGSLKPRWVMFHSRDDFATLSFREDAKATWQCLSPEKVDRVREAKALWCKAGELHGRESVEYTAALSRCDEGRSAR
jgi:hypothetical protein